MIKINGIDIIDYQLTDLWRNFSVYFQSEMNYSFTIRENLLIADEDENDEKSMLSAFSESGGDDVLNKTPHGLDTYLTKLFSNEGIEPSIGQYQKIALARTFFRKHSVLIMDEPSSSLDPKAEYELFERLSKFCEGKITFFISHRLSNVTLADKIIVLENGEIIEEGAQIELLKKAGRYAELFHYQQNNLCADIS